MLCTFGLRIVNEIATDSSFSGNDDFYNTALGMKRGGKYAMHCTPSKKQEW